MLNIKMQMPPEGFEGAKEHLFMVYEDEWFNDPLVKQMIKDIDGSDVYGPLVMNNELFGPHTFRELSSGVSVLILLLKEKDNDFPLYLTKCGDNCTPWICKIAKMVNKEVYLQHIMDFYDDLDTTAIKVENCGGPYKTGKELTKNIANYYVTHKKDILLLDERYCDL